MTNLRDCFVPLQGVLNLLRKDYDTFVLTTETNTVAIIIDSIGSINKDLVLQRQAKINDKNRRFGVFMTPLSRRNKNYKVCGEV